MIQENIYVNLTHFSADLTPFLQTKVWGLTVKFSLQIAPIRLGLVSTSEGNA